MNRDSEISRRLGAHPWPYGTQDPRARSELKERITRVARRKGLITYSDLVRGVEFRLANVNGGRPFTIEDWSELDRAVIGDFLGMINAETHQSDRVLLSALVVQKEDMTPGPGFTKFMREIGALRSESEVLEFWAEEVTKVHEVYARSRNVPTT